MHTKAKQRMVLIAILGLCILPLLLAQAAWQWARPSGGKSYGQLLAQPLLSASQLNGRPQWQLLAHGDAACGERTQQLTQIATHLQRAQGREQARLQVSQCLSLAHTLPEGIYLIDPHGNAVLRYTPEQLAEPKGRQAALREIGVVLKNNPSLG
ncbi:hypothetical protein HQ393_14035 [Chitinibacter bivalviorum]|uniref:Uncharacterized protein n=1 Tax=Chitinibacter bivalviorum TaxID=2739434 RepID=A0A7H9BME8_9NEIS|nr:hypothetical protein [Chitinibacter bivalviorum]QLG89271.1 hypothetical protein HQ393_14035 [Chitinibacter bivalviorum]